MLVLFILCQITTTPVNASGSQYIEVNGATYAVGVVNYTTNTTLRFNSINTHETYIVLNNTLGINISHAGNGMNITLMYLHNDMENLSKGETILEFYASKKGIANTTFTINGLKDHVEYEIFRNNSRIASVDGALGIVNFSNNLWSSHHFEIRRSADDGGGGGGAVGILRLFVKVTDDTVPVGSCLVTIDEKNATTDSHGETFFNLYPGYYQVSVSHHSLGTIMKNVSLAASQTMNFDYSVDEVIPVSVVLPWWKVHENELLLVLGVLIVAAFILLVSSRQRPVKQYILWDNKRR